MDHFLTAARAPSYLERVKAALTSRDPKVQALVKAANDQLLSMKLLTPSAVHNNATLTNFSVQYGNEEFIGAQLMPIKTVSKLSDIYYKYGIADRRSIPNSAVGARSDVQEVNESRSTATYSCQPYALKGFVDALTLSNQDAPLNEMLDMVASVNDAMDLGMEQRIATAMTTAANYATANTSAIAAASRWDVAGGDPIANIQSAVKAIQPSMGGASELVMWASWDVANLLQRHEHMLDLCKYTQKGLVPLDQIASQFGCSRFLTGKARQYTTNEGQSTQTEGFIWGTDNFGIARVAKSPSIRQACFGLTFQKDAKETTQWYDPAPGLSGGYFAKVGYSQDHEIVASDCAYLYTTVRG